MSRGLLLALGVVAWAVLACGDPDSQDTTGAEPVGTPEPAATEAPETATTTGAVVEDSGDGDLLQKVQERGRLVCGV